VRSARHLAAVLAVLLAAPAAALGQDPTPTTTEPLGDYTQTTPTQTIQTETTPASTQTTPTETTTDDSGVAEDTSSGGGGGTTGSGSGSPSAAPTPAPSAAPQPSTATATTAQPSRLAFTGFEAWAVFAVGLSLMGGAVVLQRRRRA
jgi:hypothetical protein